MKKLPISTQALKNNTARTPPQLPRPEKSVKITAHDYTSHNRCLSTLVTGGGRGHRHSGEQKTSLKLRVYYRRDKRACAKYKPIPRLTKTSPPLPPLTPKMPPDTHPSETNTNHPRHKAPPKSTPAAPARNYPSPTVHRAPRRDRHQPRLSHAPTSAHLPNRCPTGLPKGHQAGIRRDAKNNPSGSTGGGCFPEPRFAPAPAPAPPL